MARTTRRPAIAAAVLGASLVMAGCSVANPITTQYAYAPSDGIRVDVTDGVDVENLMILTESEGAQAHLLGAVVNSSREDVEVTFTLGESGSPIPVRAAAGETVNFTDSGVTSESSEAAPGATLPSTVSMESVGGISVEIPVLDGTIPPYDEYLEQH